MLFIYFKHFSHNIDKNGIMNITAIDKVNEKNNMIDIIKNTGRLSEEEIENLIKMRINLKVKIIFPAKQLK